MKIIQKIIGLYFFIGAIITYLFYLLTQSTDHIFSFLIPTTIATLVFLIYTLLSYLYLKYPNRTVYENGFSIMLLIQSLNIELFGYGFKNFYFPEVAIHFNLKELSDITFNCSYFYLAVLNGYFRTNANNSISINLALLLLIFVIPYVSKKITEKAESLQVDSELFNL
ncbi:hypothetical protein [Ferruginibacter sp.]